MCRSSSSSPSRCAFLPAAVGRTPRARRMVDEHTSLLGVRCDLCGVLFLTLTHPQSAGAYPLTLQAWPLWLRPDFEHREDRPCLCSTVAVLWRRTWTSSCRRSSSTTWAAACNVRRITSRRHPAACKVLHSCRCDDGACDSLHHFLCHVNAQRPLPDLMKTISSGTAAFSAQHDG